MSERFRQFQALFPEEACLAALMRLRHGGTSMSCPACGRPAQFEPRPKLRGFACQHCHYMIHPAAGTPLESRRTPLQLWFYALKTMSEQSGKAAAGMIARDSGVPQMTAQRLVDDLTTLAGRGDAGWLEKLRNLVTGKPEAVAAPVVASPPPPRPPPAPVAPAPVRRLRQRRLPPQRHHRRSLLRRFREPHPRSLRKRLIRQMPGRRGLPPAARRSQPWQPVWPA